MKIFFSAGEPSGDVHAASLIGAMRRDEPQLELCGFGGHHMAAAGCRLLYPLAEYPVIGILPALVQLGRFLNLASQADRLFRHHRPDAVVLVDNPGFNWWIARRAKFHGIPVFYFLPPQVWAWATWRVAKMRRFVDHVLCIMPFETDWYRARGVHATFTGHPYFDELRAHELDREFLAEYRSTPESPVIGILPGSRTAEVRHNLPVYLRSAAQIAREFPSARFPVAFLKEKHAELAKRELAHAQVNAKPYVGKTNEIIHASQVCMAKSGSVSLELLYHMKPSTILYQLGIANYATYRVLHAIGLMAAPYITLVNILAGHELFPEFIGRRDVSATLSGHVLNWLRDAGAREAIVAELAQIRSRVAQPGATARTAEYILNALGSTTRRRQAA
jgi:lipid-A-disaccharide synthase